MTLDHTEFEKMVQNVKREAGKSPNRYLDDALHKNNHTPKGEHPLDIALALVDLTASTLAKASIDIDDATRANIPETPQVLQSLLTALQNNNIPAVDADSRPTKTATLITRDETNRIIISAQDLYPDEPAFQSTTLGR